MKHDIAKEWNELGKDEGTGIHILDKGIQKRNKAEKDEACFEDDMEVYHPVHGTHLDDPWLHHRQKHHVRNDEYGSRKRSIGGEYLVTHKHHRRGGQQQPQNPSSFLPPGIDESAYFNGFPTAPTTDPTSSSSSSSGSALTSKPHGFASSVTGGGSSPPIVPKSINELEKLLTDPQPRVIHLDRTYDFRGSAGTCTNCAGCIPDSYAKCPSKGQLAINNGQGWCNGKPAHAVTYDKAGLTPIRMGPNKSVIGITPNAGIRGKGLLIAHQKNVILQGFTLDYINAEFIWGGDGVTIRDSDLVWIDRITFRLIGRQFIVTGYESAGRVTISNCFFDCETKWSATCDNSHYWTVLGYGKSDKVTFSGNLMKHCSGRSPRIANPDDKGGDSVWHVVNSAFEGSTGHSFDMGPGITALIEGNVFNDVTQTSLHESSPGRAFAPSDKAVCTQCKGVLGRDCQPNAYSRANPIPSTTSPGVVLKDVVGEEMVGALPPGQVREQVGSTAGCNGAKGDAVGGAGAGAVGDGGEPEGYGDTAATADAGASANPGNGQGQPNPDGGAGTGAPMPYVPGQQNPANAEPQRQPQLQPGQQQQKQTSSGNPFLDGGSGGSNPFDPNSQPEGYGQPPNAEQQKQAEQQKKQQEQQQKQAQDPMKQQQQQQQKQLAEQQKKQAEEQKKQQQKREQQEKKQQEEQQKQWQQWQQQQQQPHH
ncbi:hypothetical protein NDA16_004897 [Ustilago loliicola]|nr:hypothetical protein NDA16_004897 [Ustilago loliicola]